MKRKVVAVALVVQMLALSVFTGCGKEKLVQDKGVSSSEMSDEDINFIKNFELEPEDISKHFTNLIVTTPDGSYDILTEPMTVLETKDSYLMDATDSVYEECENFTLSQIYQPYRLDKYTGVNAADFYLNGEKDKLIFSYFNVGYFIYGDVDDSEVSVMGITNTTDLESIQELLGEPYNVLDTEQLWAYYDYIVSMNGMPMEISITWNKDKDKLEWFDIHSYCLYRSYYMEENMDISELERFYKK